MKRPIAILFAAVSVIAVAAPSNARDSARVNEFYHIFDIQTSAPKSQVIKATLDGMVNNIADSETITPIVLEQPPEQPRRFTLTNPFESSPMGGLMGMMSAAQVAQFKVARCDGAIWIANANRRVRGNQNLRLTLCLFPYSKGYQLDVYGLDASARGGGLSQMLGRAIGNAIVGDPAKWTNKTVVDIIRSIRTRASAQITYVEGQPPFVGAPWEDPSYALPTTEKTAED
jgi:hypothetical protein